MMPGCARKSRGKKPSKSVTPRWRFMSGCVAGASSFSSAMAGLRPTPTISPSIACSRRAGYQSIPAVSLSLEPANITAVANDIGTDAIFLRQLIAQARPEDIAIGISTSGGSRNIIMALEEARKRNMLTVALLGYDGGEIKRKRLADFPVVVNCDYIPRIQEVQASIYHVIRESLEG